jgi:hypothetical protein
LYCTIFIVFCRNKETVIYELDGVHACLLYMYVLQSEKKAVANSMVQPNKCDDELDATTDLPLIVAITCTNFRGQDHQLICRSPIATNRLLMFILYF